MQISGVPCVRHPGFEGEYAVVLNYLSGNNWRDVFRGATPLDAICGQCRLELLDWLSKPAPLQKEGPPA